jgi:hypothetical protein
MQLASQSHQRSTNQNLMMKRKKGIEVATIETTTIETETMKIEEVIATTTTTTTQEEITNKRIESNKDMATVIQMLNKMIEIIDDFHLKINI